jgi:predicted Co/Zn/Cd cation transporter (cation efflux family)
MSRLGSLGLCALAALSVASCASQTKTAQAGINLTPQQIQDAERAGYQVMVAKSGQTLFCHTQVKTGSHMAKQECHTVQEWDQINSRGNRESQAEIKGSSMPALPAIKND